MKFVIRFGKRLYLSKDASYVNNMTDMNIRTFNIKEKSLAVNIANDMGGELVKYEPKKSRKKQPKTAIQYTNYELNNLLVLKNEDFYYTHNMELTKKLRNKSVLKLTMSQVQNILQEYPDYNIKVVQLGTEVESKRPKPNKKANGYYVVETRYKYYLTKDDKETDNIKGNNVKRYDLELGKSLAYSDAERLGGKVKKVYRGRIIKKKFYHKKFLRGKARLIR